MGIKHTSALALLLVSALLLSGCSPKPQPPTVTITPNPEIISNYVGEPVEIALDYSREQDGQYFGNFTGISTTSACRSLEIEAEKKVTEGNPGRLDISTRVASYHPGNNCLSFVSNEEPKKLVALKVTPSQQAIIGKIDRSNSMKYDERNHITIPVAVIRKDQDNQFRLRFSTESPNTLFSETKSGDFKDINSAIIEFRTNKFSDSTSPDFYLAVMDPGFEYVPLKQIDVLLEIKSGEKWYLIDESAITNVTAGHLQK